MTSISAKQAHPHGSGDDSCPQPALSEAETPRQRTLFSILAVALLKSFFQSTVLLHRAQRLEAWNPNCGMCSLVMITPVYCISCAQRVPDAFVRFLSTRLYLLHLDRVP